MTGAPAEAGRYGPGPAPGKFRLMGICWGFRMCYSWIGSVRRRQHLLCTVACNHWSGVTLSATQSGQPVPKTRIVTKFSQRIDCFESKNLAKLTAFKFLWRVIHKVCWGRSIKLKWSLVKYFKPTSGPAPEKFSAGAPANWLNSETWNTC